jgi:hypothetical protein
MNKTHTVIQADGTAIPHVSRNLHFSQAKAAADDLRAAAVANGQPDRHYHVIASETVYVTSTLDDVLKGGA